MAASVNNFAWPSLASRQRCFAAAVSIVATQFNSFALAAGSLSLFAYELWVNPSLR